MKSLSWAEHKKPNQKAMEKTGRYNKAVCVSVLADEHRVEVCPMDGRWDLWSRLFLAKCLWFKLCNGKINSWSCRKFYAGNPHNHRESCWIQEVCVYSNVGFVCTVKESRPCSEMLCSGCWEEHSYIPQKYRFLCDNIRVAVSFMDIIRCFWGICQIGVICKITILISKSCLRE